MDWPLPDDSMTPPSLGAGNTNRIPNPRHWDPVMSRSTTVSRSYWKAGIQHLNLDLGFFLSFSPHCWMMTVFSFVSVSVVVPRMISAVLVGQSCFERATAFEFASGSSFDLIPNREDGLIGRNKCTFIYVTQVSMFKLEMIFLWYQSTFMSQNNIH